MSLHAQDVQSLLLQSNEGTGNIAYDSSGHNHHGGIHAAEWVALNPDGNVSATLAPDVPDEAEE